jgi:5'-3' exonuclease
MVIKMKKRILLFDTSAVLHAVKFSLAKHKLSHKDKPTFVIYGFLMKMQFLMRKVRPDITIFALDSDTSLRKDIYPLYKEKRKTKKTPEQIELDKIAYPQFLEVIEYVLPTIGFRNLFGAKGLEGDDIIASICKTYKDHEIVIVGNDHDLYQLLTKNVCTFDPRANRYFSLSDFKDKYEIEPKIWKRVKAIGGCSSDEVKGVPIPQPDKDKKQMHVAEKGALNFLSGKTGENTKAYKAITSRAGKDVINRNKRLVILPFRGTPKFKIVQDRMRAKSFKKVCRKYGFSSIFEDFEDWKTIFKLR